jgi:hypothetical protein
VERTQEIKAAGAMLPVVAPNHIIVGNGFNQAPAALSRRKG